MKEDSDTSINLMGLIAIQFIIISIYSDAISLPVKGWAALPYIALHLAVVSALGWVSYITVKGAYKQGREVGREDLELELKLKKKEENE